MIKKSQSELPVARDKPASGDAAGSLTACEREDKPRQRLMAELGLSSTVPNATTVQNFAKSTFGAIDLTDAVAIISEKASAVQHGNLAGLEATLTAQTVALDTIFNDLAQRAATSMGDCLNAAETYLRLALKAQAQCRATVQTLAEMKNPHPVAFVKQANIAHGPQQVNNPDPMERAFRARPRARRSAATSNELLE